MSHTAKDIIKNFAPLITEHKGTDSASFSTLTSLDQSQEGALVFLLKKPQVEMALKSGASVVLAPAKLAEDISPEQGQCWIFSKNVELLMAQAKSQFLCPTPYRSDYKNTKEHAHIDPSAKLDPSAVIGPGAFIGANVTIGKNSYVGANTVMEDGSVLGDHSTLHPLVYLGARCQVGNHCEVLPNTSIGTEGFGYAHDHTGGHHRIPHSGIVILKDHVHVGSNCAIDRGAIDNTVIGEGTKIDNLCHFAHNAVIGKKGLFTAQFAMAGSSTIGDHFVCGGNTSVTGHITIADQVHVAGMSGVTKSISEPGEYGGFPLQKLRSYLKTKAALIHLPELRSQVKKLLPK